MPASGFRRTDATTNPSPVADSSPKEASHRESSSAMFLTAGQVNVRFPPETDLGDVCFRQIGGMSAMRLGAMDCSRPVADLDLATIAASGFYPLRSAPADAPPRQRG